MAKFEECLQRLEKIVQELEKGEVPLEKSLTLFEEGMQLSASLPQGTGRGRGQGGDPAEAKWEAPGRSLRSASAQTLACFRVGRTLLSDAFDVGC